MKRIRIGFRVRRVYDERKTAMDLLASERGSPRRLSEVQRLWDRLDPIKFSEVIDQNSTTTISLITGAAHGRSTKIQKNSTREESDFIWQDLSRQVRLFSIRAWVGRGCP